MSMYDDFRDLITNAQNLVGTLGTWAQINENNTLSVPTPGHKLSTFTGSAMNEPLEVVEQTPPIPIDYNDLLEKMTQEGKTDLDADRLDEALFMFAIGKVRSFRHDIPYQLAPFIVMGEQYAPHWRKRLQPEAWAIVHREIKHKLHLLGWSPTTGKGN